MLPIFAAFADHRCVVISYYFFPGFIFQAISYFTWTTWISPTNANLATVTGMLSGVGLNPWPTFDFQNLTVWLSPLTIPTFAIMNQGVGILIGALMYVLQTLRTIQREC